MKLSHITAGTLLCVGFGIALAQSKTPESRLVFPTSGFSIAALDAPNAATTYQALVMTLPASAGFAPNVNVQVQPFPGDFASYMSLSEEQMSKIGWTIISKKADAHSATYEFKGLYQQRQLHWYSKAVAGKGKIYLVTATAAEEQWAEVSEALKASVESIRREGPAD